MNQNLRPTDETASSLGCHFLGLLSRPPEAERSIAANLCDEWGFVSLQKTPNGGKGVCKHLGHFFSTQIAALLEDKYARMAHVDGAKGRSSIAQLEIFGEHDPAAAADFKKPGLV